MLLVICAKSAGAKLRVRNWAPSESGCLSRGNPDAPEALEAANLLLNNILIKPAPFHSLLLTSQFACTSISQ